MTASALLLAALLAPAVAQDPPVTEIECSYVTAPDGQPGDVVNDANLKVLVQTAAPGQYRSGLPAGVEIACVRSSIVPAPNDWEVIMDGHPFYIVEQLPSGGYDRIGVIEFTDGRFRYRLVRGQLNAEEARRVDRRVNEFQAARP